MSAAVSWIALWAVGTGLGCLFAIALRAWLEARRSQRDAATLLKRITAIRHEHQRRSLMQREADLAAREASLQTEREALRTEAARLAAAEAAL